ncbi:hypothetical protein CHS0354_001939 [Potamilus streckersoni]|uniref:Sugar ABC transporter substrate-binding protein n=1 Tax=Potamilus streckersoni TaxID=2493646 RepID=A0AAE0T5G4_9BIVA|nr:hypothetical protein CHS0354_001939 [Potamilus streckersoni]
MIEMQKFSKEFEKANPGITLKWVTLEEGVLRQRVTTDITTKGGQFDIMTIGMYETPIWGKKGWLVELKTGADYDAKDILPAMRNGLSVDEKITQQNKDVYGICLRGKPGWGDNMAFLTTMVNSFGGQWFDMQWKPQLTSAPWEKAITFYVDMMKKFGPPGSTSNSFNEILALYNEGKCGMWIDATIAASFITDPKQSKVADKVAFAQSPVEATDRGANWLWAWALAIPAGSKNAAEAQKFIEWATSKKYIEYVAGQNGWARVPTGTRQSTYDNPEFKKSAVFAEAELKAIMSADPNNSTLPKSPYVGVQFAAIPEFQAIGVAAGQQIASALAGKISVKQALKNAQQSADREMRKGKYYK